MYARQTNETADAPVSRSCASRDPNEIGQKRSANDKGMKLQSADRPVPMENDRTTAYAQILLASRRKRDTVLEGLTLGEPEWDILLDAFVAKGRHEPLPVSSLCVTANVSVSTALRHINSMITIGYLRRYRDIVDQRRSLVEMTEWGERKVRICINSIMVIMDDCGQSDLAGREISIGK